MRDKTGNRITLTESPNQHLLIWGQSGQGKTFCSYRSIEKAVASGKSVLILDFSGSYTLPELEKNEMKLGKDLIIHDVYEEKLCWKLWCKGPKEYLSALADALVNSLGIQSYYQRKLVRQALEKQTDFSIPSFMNSLEHKRMDAETSKDDKKNIDHLLTRLMLFENLDHFLVCPIDREKNEGDVMYKPATIIQLSGYSEMERKFLMSFILNLLWSETRLNQKSVRCDMLVLDEIQALSLRKGSAFSAMLREGRRYGLGVLAATQFISAYDKEELEALMQAGHFIIFKPSVNDIAFSARMIDRNDMDTWKRILSRLQRGQAVLVGSYTVNARKSTADSPIICNI